MKVNAFTTGQIYSKWGTGGNVGNAFNTCNNNQCSVATNLGTPVHVECETEYCFATFELTYTITQIDQQNNYASYQSAIFTQMLVTKNNHDEWNICETGNGIATCMIKNNSDMKRIEMKYNSSSLNQIILRYTYNLDNGTIFNSPNNVQQQLNNIQQQNQTNWNNFNNADISQQDQTPPDTTTIDSVQAQETQQITDIQTAIQNIQAPTFDLTDFRNTFAWIWQTIIYLFTTHTILMSTMTIVLSLGFVKTIFGR